MENAHGQQIQRLNLIRSYYSSITKFVLNFPYRYKFVASTICYGEILLDDSQIRAMVSYVVNYFYENCPENLDAMVHLIGHDERYRKRVEEITEAILDHHDELFVSCSSGKNIAEITPKYAKQCEEIRQKMRTLVVQYVSENSQSG
ncbi:MAG: hypothetical protein NWF06_01830, partial [Candidatus Bathyarchaeota archaeon]|nr:hypothetical protein [Candidatus Bathyarchaeum sp.]